MIVVTHSFGYPMFILLSSIKNSLFLHYCQTYVSDKNTKIRLEGKRFVLSHDFRYFSHGSRAPWYYAENKTESNDKKQKIFLTNSRWGKERNRTR